MGGTHVGLGTHGLTLPFDKREDQGMVIDKGSTSVGIDAYLEKLKMMFSMKHLCGDSCQIIRSMPWDQIYLKLPKKNRELKETQIKKY